MVKITFREHNKFYLLILPLILTFNDYGFYFKSLTFVSSYLNISCMVMLAGYWFSRLKLFYSMSELLLVKADFLVAKDEDFYHLVPVSSLIGRLLYNLLLKVT